MRLLKAHLRQGHVVMPGLELIEICLSLPPSIGIKALQGFLSVQDKWLLFIFNFIIIAFCFERGSYYTLLVGLKLNVCASWSWTQRSFSSFVLRVNSCAITSGCSTFNYVYVWVVWVCALSDGAQGGPRMSPCCVCWELSRKSSLLLLDPLSSLNMWFVKPPF